MNKTFTEHDAERIIDTHELQQELKEQFLEHTGYIFDWSECHCFIKENETTKYIENLDLEEAIQLIEDGWAAMPF